MGILSIQQLIFGVEDMVKAIQFLNDFGLKAATDNSEQSALFSTQNHAKVIVKPMNDPSLPKAFEPGSTLRMITWSVEDEPALEEIRIKVSNLPEFKSDNNSVMCVDPNGLTHQFKVNELKSLNLKPTALNQYGNYQRIDEPSPIYEKAEPINIGHVVFFCEDLVAMESFFVDILGFYVSDRYLNDRGVFLRAQEKGGHHNIFILKVPNKSIGLNHVAFTVRDIHEVFGGGLSMEKNKWATFIGPGRHPISSAYFWYIKSPCGGAFEYYSNEDSLTSNWKPRELIHSVEKFTEWAIEGGIDYETRRQYKPQ